MTTVWAGHGPREAMPLGSTEGEVGAFGGWRLDISKLSGNSQRAEGSEVSNFHSDGISVCRARAWSMIGKRLACLVIAVGAVTLVSSGCSTKPASSTAHTPVTSQVAQTVDKPAATTAKSDTEAQMARATAAKPAAAAAKQQAQRAVSKVVAAKRKPTAVAARKHKQLPSRRKAPPAVKPAAATAGKQKQAAVPTTVAPASKPVAATAGKSEQAGAWASPVRSLSPSSCGPSGCGPTGCPVER